MAVNTSSNDPENNNDRSTLKTCTRLEDFVASDVLLKLIRFRLLRVRETKTPLPHCLFVGERGMGKRTMARVIAAELGQELQIADCRTLKAPRDVLPYLTNAGYGSVLLFSNADAITKSVLEFVEPAAAEFRVDITLGEGVTARTINMKLQPFTIIATTEDAKAVPSYFRTDFDMLSFGNVLPNELAKHICRRFKDFPPELAMAITEECDLKPANTLQIARRLIEYGHAVANGKLSRSIIRQAISDLGIQASSPAVIDGTPKRETIPTSVREIVWRRDGGKCVRCGSNVRLEFDHIVPVSKGGSNTARNIELLCESCNRRKGAKLGLFD